MKTAGVALVTLLLLILSASSASAGVGIAIASPPLDDLVVTLGQEFTIGVRVYNNGDNAFVVRLEATEGLPVTFAKNDFELATGTSTQVKTTFIIPSGWQVGEVHEGDISVTALTPEGAPGGTASAQVLGSISKHVVLEVGGEPYVPEEPEGPTTFGISVVLGVEPGVARPNRTFSQDEVVVITVSVEVEANLTCVFHIPQGGESTIDLEQGSEYYVGRLELSDIPPEKYLLSVTASDGKQNETLWTFFVVEPAGVQLTRGEFPLFYLFISVVIGGVLLIPVRRMGKKGSKEAGIGTLIVVLILPSLLLAVLWLAGVLG